MTHKTAQGAKFADFKVGKRLLQTLTQKGFITPTPIQHQVIAGALEGKDVIGIAQTGTGKTLAFGIPMVKKLTQENGQGLIVVPTRELASQVNEALTQIGGPLGLSTAVIIGGVSQHSQVRAIKRNPDIVIATPGRLADLIDQGLYRLNRVSVITLDEADRMLDVGFLPQITKLLQKAPKDKQVMLFSATMPKAISKLASQFMRLPLRIEIAPQGTSSKNIEQELFIIPKSDKMRLIDALLEEYKEETTLIFSRTKHGAKRIARDIRYMGHTATEIHGNRSQPQRKAALEGFTKGKFRVMVATDIAARGIDVKDITLVINFDLPDSIEDYVHRIGRTGRAGRSGKAISFATPDQKRDVKRIEKLIRKSINVLDLPELPPKRKKSPRPPRQHGGGRPSYKGKGGGNKSGKKYGKKHSGKEKKFGSNDSQNSNKKKSYRSGKRNNNVGSSRTRNSGGNRRRRNR